MTRKERKQALAELSLTEESVAEFIKIGKALGKPQGTYEDRVVAYIREHISAWRQEGWTDELLAAQLGAATGVGVRGALALIRLALDKERAEGRASTLIQPKTGDVTKAALSSSTKLKPSSPKQATSKARFNAPDHDQRHESDQTGDGSQPALEPEPALSSLATSSSPPSEHPVTPDHAQVGNRPSQIINMGPSPSDELEDLFALSGSQAEPKR